MRPLLLFFALCLIYAAYIANAKPSNQVNVEVTLHRRDAYQLFSHEEIWGFEYVNKSLDIVQLNVVIDEAKSLQLQSSLSNDNNTIMSLHTIYSNVSQVLEQEFARLDKRTRWTAEMKPDLFFLEYRDWLEYEAFFEWMLFTCRDVVSLSYLSEQTIQGRNIPIFTLSTGGGDNKPGFYIQAELHAREWLANAATTYILHELCEGYQTGDEQITQVLNNVNIFIVPTVNIDGYIYSWISSETRMWRKNRRNNGNNVFGVDLNRNYDAPQWCQVGTSTNPSSNIYCGTAPFSEPEARATRDFVLDPFNNIRAVFDMHTYGPLILWPWAYTYDHAPDYAELKEFGDALQAAVHSVNDHVYTSQQAADLYPCAGTMVDFAYDNGVAESITFEGRGPGFNAPPENIVPAGEEQLAAVVLTAQKLFE